MISQTSPSEDIALQVNGETKFCLASTSLSDFLVQIGLNPRLIAIEYNGEILTRALWSETTLQPGDQLEIVTIVGGGASDV
ncbi:thiamine biosynthesis protein ThiS [Synechococcus sp. PCC 7335]|uniref:sulfur carrier protein ThiS n=1 Tax=Synechococcus sp. (strain ATCC 29403 / PCC 7335) TaxID=91464 RepID=UPI00017ED554|nr:sulfur carrier protein ThiS [Synechococcus sp. PCC 7335]EDX84594.1 thiamine biosynthesis protein ThiS [Synechococcus sp. PCC 7335]